MLSALISILISLNLEFTVINESSVAMPKYSFEVMTSSDEFNNGCKDGSLYDLKFYFDDKLEQEVVVLPDVDPQERE